MYLQLCNHHPDQGKLHFYHTEVSFVPLPRQYASLTKVANILTSITIVFLVLEPSVSRLLYYVLCRFLILLLNMMSERFTCGQVLLSTSNLQMQKQEKGGSVACFKVMWQKNSGFEIKRSDSRAGIPIHFTKNQLQTSCNRACFGFIFCPDLFFAGTLSFKTSLREAVFLTVNSTLFNFPLDRMAIFSSAKDMTVLKVEWVIKWKIVSWESHVGLSGGSSGHEAHAAILSNVSRKGLEVLHKHTWSFYILTSDVHSLCSFFFFNVSLNMCLPQYQSLVL